MAIKCYLNRLDPLLATMEIAAHAANVGYLRAQAKLRSKSPGGLARRPGAQTPLWNVLAKQVRHAAQPFGTKARLARYLGLPRQRLTEYLSSRRRLPDAEVTLRLIHWLETLKDGRDVTL